MFKDYLDLLVKVDQFSAGLHNKYPDEISCRGGCSGCCIAGITVWRIEFDRISQFVCSNGAERRDDPTSICAFLNREAMCSIYPARPLVCRMWGVPMLLSDGIFEGLDSQKHVLSETHDGKALICCDLNFREKILSGKLDSDCMIDADLTLTTLSAINHVYCRRTGNDPRQRLQIE